MVRRFDPFIDSIENEVDYEKVGVQIFSNMTKFYLNVIEGSFQNSLELDR